MLEMYFIVGNATGNSSVLAQQAIVDGLTQVASSLTGEDVAIVEKFVSVVDSFASEMHALDDVEQVDHVLTAVCDAVNDDGNGVNSTATTFSEDSFSLTCAQPSDTDGSVVVSTESVSLVAYNTSGASATVTTWVVDTEGNATDGATLMADVQGISITFDDGSSATETDSVGDGGYQITIDLVTDLESTDELRKRVSCKYFSRNSSTWSSRGVYLRGISVEADGDHIAVAGICVSTHLTLFTITDEGEESKGVAAKVQLVAERIDALSNVDLFSVDTVFNVFVPALFGGITVVFFAIVAIGKVTRHKDAVDDARMVFAQYGRLARPTVLGGDEFEAILRGWVRGGQVLGLVFLQILAVNPFIGLFFRWSHETIVFTASDKAFILYASLLSTFLVQAFFFDTDSGGGPASFATIMTNTFIGAFVANFLLFPVQYLLPFMIANVHSFTTNTAVPRSLIQLQLNALKSRLQRCLRGRSTGESTKYEDREREKRLFSTMHMFWTKRVESRIGGEIEADAVGINVSLNVVSKVSKLAKKVAHKAKAWDQIRRVEKVLRFLTCRIPLCSRATIRGQAAEQQDLAHRQDAAAAADAVSKNAKAAAVISKFQRKVREAQLTRRRIRLLEFETWYKDCNKERAVLTAINSIFLLTLATFTMMICILLSAAFNDAQCVEWVKAVGQSILMQIVVTAPLIGSVVLGVKMLASVFLLRCSAAMRVGNEVC